MATNEERRAVATALRVYGGKGADADTNGEVMAIIIGAGGFEGWSWREVFARLADLIEPPTQCPYYHSDRHHCSAYDDVVYRAALLALADEMDEIGREHDAGMRMIGGHTMEALARRIREACGEVG